MNYIDRFNVNAKVPYSRVQKLTTQIQALGGNEQKTDTTNRPDFSPELIKLGMEMTEKKEELRQELITELVTIFFNLSNEERDNLDIQERFEMYEMIEKHRPSLIRFLALSSPLSSEQMGDIHEQELLTDLTS